MILAIFVEVLVLTYLFPEWGTVPKIILATLLILTIIVPVVILVKRRKKFLKNMLS
jgi:hypothetical protein